MAIIGFILGTVLGSFVKVLADRSLTNKSFWGRSYCPHCKKKLRWYDLFPILSYIFLKGRCRYCEDKISPEYLLVEVGMGILAGFLFFSEFQSFPNPAGPFKSLIFFSDLLFKTFFITILIPLFLTDLKKMFIPDRIILPSLAIGASFLLIETLLKIGYLYYYLVQTALGQTLLPPHSDYFSRHALITAEPLFGGILMGLLIAGFFMALIVITKGKGMGGGDVKLGGFIGLMLGFPLALAAIVSSFILGALFSIFLIIAGKKHFGQAIPFGPFLVLGSLISLFWGNQIWEWYLRLGY